MNKSTSLSVAAVQCFKDHGPVVFSYCDCGSDISATWNGAN